MTGTSRVLDEIGSFGRALPLHAVGELADLIGSAPVVFLHGLGRSGLVLRMLAVRLTHLEVPCHVVGDPTTPAIQPGELLVVASGSGGTRGTVAIAERGREIGARVVALTAHPEAPIGVAADRVVALPGVAKTDRGGSVQPPGSIFEQMLLVLLEEVVLRLAARRDPAYDAVARRHANLE
jgi:6-phospho-3-hexuloisomerase